MIDVRLLLGISITLGLVSPSALQRMFPAPNLLLPGSRAQPGQYLLSSWWQGISHRPIIHKHFSSISYTRDFSNTLTFLFLFFFVHRCRDRSQQTILVWQYYYLKRIISFVEILGYFQLVYSIIINFKKYHLDLGWLMSIIGVFK